MSEVLAIVPVQLLAEVEGFISTHRGITFREAESAVMALRKYSVEGAILHQQQLDIAAKREEELRLLHERLAQPQE